jgi:hypothetical protein
MSKNEFDELLLKKLREADFEYNPAGWEKLSQLLPPVSDAAAGDSSFDALLVNKLDTEELEYKAEHWEQLAGMLPPALAPVADQPTLIPAGKRRWALAAGIAAALVLAVGSAVFFSQMNHTDTAENNQPQVATNTKTATNATAPQSQQSTGQTAIVQSIQPTATPNNINNQANIQANKTNNIAAQNNQQAHNNTTQNSFFNTNLNPVVPQVLPQQPQNIARNEPSPQPTIVVPQPNPVVDNPVYHEPTPAPGVATPVYAYNEVSDASAFYEGNANTKRNAKTSISLGGGVNYGNLNAGYTAGITVRRKVAGDFFVDGTVAMMYNNNASNVAVNNGPSLADANTAARPSSFNETPLASPALDPIQKLYYVQFNPSIGYQVEKHVALSVGGDFQQMLNKKEEIVQPESNNSKVFPNFDVGLTTKSEFSITPNIQAGLMYREGLNNLLKNDGSKYVNRRYVQVQFKYNIPVN